MGHPRNPLRMGGPPIRPTGSGAPFPPRPTGSLWEHAQAGEGPGGEKGGVGECRGYELGSGGCGWCIVYVGEWAVLAAGVGEGRGGGQASRGV